MSGGGQTLVVPGQNLNAYGYPSSGEAPSFVYVGPAPPIDPVSGSLWFDSVGIQLYLWYVDPNSGQWVPVSNQALAGFLALTGGTMLGPITLAGGAAAPLQAVTLQQTQQIATAAAGVNVGRNFVDNALFNVQQRGGGAWNTNGAYTADRWVLLLSGDTASISVISAATAQRQAINDESLQYVLNNTWTGVNAAANYTSLAQKIEKVRRLSGKTITVSFYAQAGVPLSLGLSIDQNFGTGGSPSPGVQGPGQAIPITATFARYSATFAVPSTTAATLGTNGDDNTQLNFWFSTGANLASRSGIGVQSGTVQLWGVQVEIGSTATPLEKLDPATDLRRCQRFYETSNDQFWFYQASTVDNGRSGRFWFKTTKRAVPTVTAPGTDHGYSTLFQINQAGFTAGYTPGDTTTVIQVNNVWTASADL